MKSGMTHEKLDIVVVGGGIAGLSAAISIALNGHNAIVLEAAKEVKEVGAGIQISSNSTKILKRWGIWDTLELKANIPLFTDFRHYQTNEIYSVADHTLMAELYGGPFGNFHRATLHQLLLKKALSLGVVVQADSRVHSINFDEPSVTLENQIVVKGDLIVGADGYKSKCSEYFRGTHDKPKFSGDMAYRIIVDFEDVSQDALLEDIANDNCIHYWMGPGTHFVSYACDNNRYYNVVILTKCDQEPNFGMSSTEADLREMCTKFKDWHPLLQQMLTKVKATSTWQLWMRDTSSEWSHANGKFTLAGDAAHVTVPYIGQGAGMGIEDGCVIGEALGRIKAKKDLASAVQAYDKVRIERCARIVQMSRDMGVIMHLQDGPAAESRNELMKLPFPLKGDPNLWRDPSNAEWLYGFDAFKATEEAFQGNVNGVETFEN